MLFGVDLRIGAGQVVTLLGRNGMGKTTLLRTLFGQLPLRGGAIRFAGQDISGWSPDRIARLGMAIVPEGRQCFPNLTVREHLTAFVAARNPDIGAPWTPERVFELFPRLGERARNMGNQLSGGEQQMLAIGRALVTNPRLLILDEATEGLAPKIREEIWNCGAAARGRPDHPGDRQVCRALAQPGRPARDPGARQGGLDRRLAGAGRRSRPVGTLSRV